MQIHKRRLLTIFLACFGLLYLPITTTATPPYWELNMGEALPDLTGEDDAETSVPLSFSFPFGMASYDTITVSTNGLIGLGTAGSFNYRPDGTDFFDAAIPIIAPFWSDLDLSSIGAVRFNDFGDHAVITWDTVGSYQSPLAPFSFQLQLYAGGSFIFSYNGISDILANLDEDLLVGISPGGGVADPGAIQYLAYTAAAYTGGLVIYEVFSEAEDPFTLDQHSIQFMRLLPTELTMTVQVPESSLAGLVAAGAALALLARRRRTSG
jgi:hypothetical protein